jgi:serine/threonine-protein kinase
MDPQAKLGSALAERYAFKHEIGRGGMAVVYLAEDIKHGRRVAVKVLHPDLGALIGTERFLAEIRITANLQHPNLLPLFDSGEVHGLLYYVMPFVDGESLRARLSREKQLPIEDALHIATTVASALDHAHRHGVIHRDLKPENILLHEGEPLIADFGIALAVSNAAANRLTQTGLSLGTPQYMSPEQATGERSIDARADIYALAAVLYEMLTGEPPHTGATAQAVIAKVLGEPARSVRFARDAVPPHVDAAILRALAKIPADRWSTAQAFAAALMSAPTGAVMNAASVGQPSRAPFATRVRQSAPFAAAALALGALGVLGVLRPWRHALEIPYAFVVTLPDSATVSTGGGASGEIAISRDGKTIAYVAGTIAGGDVTRGIWTRGLDELTAKPVRGLERAQAPRYSPDGQALGYLEGGSLYTSRLSGNQPTLLARESSSFDWIDGESMLYTVGREQWASRHYGSEVWVTTVHNPTPRRLVARDTARQIFGVGLPSVLPGGRYALVTISKDAQNPRREIAVASLKDGAITELGLAGNNARYSLGHLLFVKEDGGLYAVPFSLDSRRVTGAAVQIVPQIVVKVTGWADYDVADNGTLVYVGGSEARRRLVLVDRSGRSSQLLPEIRRFYFPRVSPDGRRVAVEIGSSQGFDIWTYDLASKTLGALTTDHLSIRPGGWLDRGSSLTYIQVDSEVTRFTPRVRCSAPTLLLAEASSRFAGEISKSCPSERRHSDACSFQRRRVPATCDCRETAAISHTKAARAALPRSTRDR